MHELSVEVILAGSPQAKGRVERSNGTLQDRLVKALRHHGVTDLPAANAFLESGFLEDLNRRFTVAPARRADVHRRLLATVKLDRILALHEERQVQNDWTVRWHNRWLQVARRHRALQLAGRRVTVCEQLDGQLRLLYQGQELEWQELPAAPPRAKPPRHPPTPGDQPSWKPPANHPWRNGLG